MSERTRTTVEHGIATVYLNRPEKLNALDMDMFRAIDDSCKSLARRRDVRVAILAAEGSDFCSGLDVKSIFAEKGNAPRLLAKWLPWQANLAQRVSVGWSRLRVPVIAAIHGRCWGGGMQIVLGADIRIVHPDSSLSIMEGKWGLIPDMGGSLALRHLVGADQALKLTVTAEEFSGRKALEWGLATECSEQPMQAARALAEQICERSPDAVTNAKKLYRGTRLSSEGWALLRESWLQIRTLSGKNQRIAVRRQQGKNDPWVI